MLSTSNFFVCLFTFLNWIHYQEEIQVWELFPLDLQALEQKVSTLIVFKQKRGQTSVLAHDFLCFRHSISDSRAKTE